MPSPPVETVGEFEFHRTCVPRSKLRTFTAIDQLAAIRAMERRLLDLTLMYKPDIIHAHSPVLNAWAALRVGRQTRTPVVYEVRGLWEDAAIEHRTARQNGARYWFSRNFETLALRRADAIVTISDGLYNDFITRGIPKLKITKVPNAVDANRFLKPQISNELPSHIEGASGNLTLGFIGSFYSYEGLDLLLEALPRLIQKIPRLQLLLIGSGPEENRLRRITEESGLSPHVKFLGRIPEEAVPDAYRLMDILIYPRNSARLTELVTPLKPLEAMAQGRIVVASNVGGHRELIQDQRTGYLFPPGDPIALANRIFEVLRLRTDWPRVTTAARVFVESERTWQNVVTSYRDVYNRLLCRDGVRTIA